jgi:hypothetical protein
MDFDLKEVGATIILGAYLLFGLEIILYLIFGSNVYLTLENSTRFTSRALLSLSVALCFAFGMLMEDVSDKGDDRDTYMQRIIQGVIPFAKTDNQIKFETLYGEDEKELDRLAAEMASAHLLCNYGGPGGSVVEDWVLGKHNLDSFRFLLRKEYRTACEVKADVAEQLYYHAKNIVFLQENYYDELKKIQLRIDFARTFLAISTLLAPLTLVLAAARGLKLARLMQRGRRSPGIKHLEDKVLRFLALRLLARTAMITAALVFFSGLAAFSYNAEERQFDMRAYGYFSSLHASENSAVKPVKGHRISQLKFSPNWTYNPYEAPGCQGVDGP